MSHTNKYPQEIFLTIDKNNFTVSTEWDDEENEVRYIRADTIIWGEVALVLKEMAEIRRECELCQKNICSLHTPMSFLLEPYLYHESKSLRKKTRRYYERKTNA